MKNLHLIRITRNVQKGEKLFTTYSFLGDNQDGSGKFFTSFEQAQKQAAIWLEMERILMQSSEGNYAVIFSQNSGRWSKEGIHYSIDYDLIEIGNIVPLKGETAW